MIVEVHGIPVWTRVRFPPGPFLKINEITQLRVLETVENYHILIGNWYYAIGLILPCHHKLKDFCCTF